MSLPAGPDESAYPWSSEEETTRQRPLADADGFDRRGSQGERVES